MKIGILTYHRSHNYGALLQAIATRTYLTKFKHEVYYIDYWPKYHKEIYEIFSYNIFKKKSLLDKCRYLKYILKHYKNRKRRFNNFTFFIEKYISPYCNPVDKDIEYDCIIYGSDQIWRHQMWNNNLFNPVYFGHHNIKTKKHVSYAASMGEITIDLNDSIFLRTHLSRFDWLGVREEQLLNKLNGLNFYNTQLNIDPTLLFNAKEWNKIIPSYNRRKKKYILYYNLLNGSFNEKSIQEIAQKEKLEIVYLHGSGQFIESKNSISTGGPDVMIELIRNADFVFTSSYHGLVFSIIYNKPFYASFINNSSRAYSLLNTLGITDRLLTPMIDIEKLNYSIEYDKVNKILDEQKKESINFLNKIIL